jgi:hypothetical protein
MGDVAENQADRFSQIEDYLMKNDSINKISSMRSGIYITQFLRDGLQDEQDLAG